MSKKLFNYSVLVIILGLALVHAAQAEPYGPPAGLPAGMPDLSQIMNNIPGGIPGGMPAGVPTNMGPSAEQSAKFEEMQKKGEEMQREAEKKGEEMQKKGEEKQREAEKKAFEKMSKNINQFERAVKIIKTQVEKLNKKGAPTTPDMKIELDKLDAFLAKLKSSTTIEQLQPLFEEFSDLIDSAQEQLQIMSKASKWPSVEKQAGNLIAKLTKESTTLKAKAAKKDLTEELAESFTELDKAIAEQKAALETLKTQVKTDPDTVFDNIGDYFDKFRDIYENNVREINSTLDLKKAVKTELPKFVKALDNRVKTLARNKKINTTELKALVASANTKLNEIKTLVAAKTVDHDAVISAIDALTDISVQFEDKWEALTGQDNNNLMPKLPDTPADYKINIPASLNSLIK